VAEMTDACNAISQELFRLTEFVQWADTVVSSAETAMEAKSVASDCSEALQPECFYIGDGIIAQLLADAEAVAQAPEALLPRRILAKQSDDAAALSYGRSYLS